MGRQVWEGTLGNGIHRKERQYHLRHIPGRQMASEGEDMVPLPLEGRDARY